MFYSERNLSFSLPLKMFSKFVPTLYFPQDLSVFSLSRNQQTAPLPPSSTFLCFVSPCFQLFFRYLARSTKQTWKSCFCFFTEGKQHNAHEIDTITLRNHAPRSYMTWGTFHSTQNSRKFRLVNQMERTISVWSDRNIRDQLWRWSTLTGPVISVGRTEMSRSIWPNLLSTVPLFRILLTRTITKRAVAWVGFVQQKCTRSPGHVEFPKFQTGIFVEWKAPMITRDPRSWYKPSTIRLLPTFWLIDICRISQPKLLPSYAFFSMQIFHTWEKCKFTNLKTLADPHLETREGPGHPDPEIRGGGSQFFWPFGPQFGLQISGGRRPRRASPLDPPLKKIAFIFFRLKIKKSAQSYIISCAIKGDLEGFFCWRRRWKVFEKTVTRCSRFKILARRTRFLKYWNFYFSVALYCPRQFSTIFST